VASVVSAWCARLIAYSCSTGASALSRRITTSPSRTGDELVEHVHHAEQVECDPVERIDLERRLERRARGGLVSGSQQVRAEIGERPRILRIERQGAARERDRFVEPIVVRGQLAGDAVDVAVAGGNRERLVRRRLELLRLVLHEGERGQVRVGSRLDGFTASAFCSAWCASSL